MSASYWLGALNCIEVRLGWTACLSEGFSGGPCSLKLQGMAPKIDNFRLLEIRDGRMSVTFSVTFEKRIQNSFLFLRSEPDLSCARA